MGQWCGECFHVTGLSYWGDISMYTETRSCICPETLHCCLPTLLCMTGWLLLPTVFFTKSRLNVRCRFLFALFWFGFLFTLSDCGCVSLENACFHIDSHRLIHFWSNLHQQLSVCAVVANIYWYLEWFCKTHLHKFWQNVCRLIWFILDADTVITKKMT